MNGPNEISPDKFYELSLTWKTVNNTPVRCNGEGVHVYFPEPYSRKVMIAECNCETRGREEGRKEIEK